MVNEIRSVLKPEKYQEFVDILRDLGNDSSSTNETAQRVCTILEGHEDIQQHFLYLVHMKDYERSTEFADNQYIVNSQNLAYLQQPLPPFLPSFPP